MLSIVLDPGHTRDTKGLHIVGDFLESTWGDRHTFNETMQYYRCQDSYIYIFHLGMKKEITDFMRVGMEDEPRRYFEGHDT